MLLYLLIGWLAAGLPLAAQEAIGRTSASEVKVSGAVEIAHGETALGNGSEITAGEQAVDISLQRGGSLHLCSTSSLHLSRDRSIADPADSALMMALDRGALEADYAVGKYSDVLLTPDLRILVSGPGQARLSLRVNPKGDTCVDNDGADAPYVTVSSQLEGGAYRVMPNQRVTFEHGSLQEVVDHEPEPCGCPVTPVDSLAGTKLPGPPPGGPSSTVADTAFPIAESEGLAPPPAPSTKPVVPAGQSHAQVTVPLTYNGEAPPTVAAASVPASAAAAATSGPAASPAAVAQPAAIPQPASTSGNNASPPAGQEGGKPAGAGGGLLHRIGRFFSKIFGK